MNDDKRQAALIYSEAHKTVHDRATEQELEEYYGLLDEVDRRKEYLLKKLADCKQRGVILSNAVYNQGYEKPDMDTISMEILTLDGEITSHLFTLTNRQAELKEELTKLNKQIDAEYRAIYREIQKPLPTKHTQPSFHAPTERES